MIPTPESLEQEYLNLKLEQSSMGGPSANNRASEMGHPCTAYCFYSRVVPAEMRKPIDARLALIFGEGRAHERLLQINLQEMGYDLSHQQKNLYLPGAQIAGHQDFRISKNGEWFRSCELKSCSPFIFNSCKTAEDILNYKWYIVRKWYSQTVLYMALRGDKEYWLILKNKQGGAIRVIPFVWNDAMQQHFDDVKSKAGTVNRLVARFHKQGSVVEKFALRDRLKIKDPKICPDCTFFTVCAPRITLGPGVRMLDDPEIEAKLNRHGELEEGADEYAELDSELKEYFKAVAPEHEVVTCGDWIVNLNRSTRGEGDKKQTVTRIGFSRVPKSNN